MSFLNPALLLGLGLVAIPVVLHLLLRARPKRLIFPALRLLQLRRTQNVRRLRLRHLWLLLLRMAVVAVIVVALARPSLPPANYAPTWSELWRLAGCCAVGAAVYVGVMTWWRRRALPRHVFLTRRTMLRGGLGGATALAALLLVAWPYQRRVAAEMAAPAPNAIDDLPVAAVFLCDTSLSMQYQQEGVSRLEAARRIAVAHLGQLPPGSKAAVFDGVSEAPAVFTPDLTAARNRLESLTFQAACPVLNEGLRTALRFQTDDQRRTLGEQASVAESRRQDRFVREVYILTDLAKTAWRVAGDERLRDELKAAEWLGVYIIDVGVEQPQNIGLTSVKPSRAAVSSSGSVLIDATISSSGPVRRDQVVELYLQSESGRAVKRDQQTVRLAEGAETQVRFALDGLTGKHVQGELKLVAADPLPFDDVGYFTVRVLPPLNVAVVGDDRATVQFWMEALSGLSAGGAATYKPTYVHSGRLLDQNLTQYDAVCLLNVRQPPVEVWQKLQKFVADGGGLCVFLGAPSALTTDGQQPAIDPVSYNSFAAQDVLPATLKAHLKFSPPQHLNFRDSGHPLRQRLEELGALAELGDVDVRQYWSVAPTAGALPLARWTDDAALPAVLLRDVDRGRALLMATSVDSIRWSDLPGSWTFLVLADQFLQLVCRRTAEPANFRAGDPVLVSLPRDARLGPCLLRAPDLTQRTVEAPPDATDFAFPKLTALGHYEVVPVERASAFSAAFSLNPPAAESQLARLTTPELDELLGARRYGLARDPQQLVRSVTAGRLGQEIYGLLVACLLAIFVGEQLTATWFYSTDETESAPA